MAIKLVNYSSYKAPSVRQMLLMDQKIEELKKSGKPMKVLEGVKTITFKKNKGKVEYTFGYQERDRNIIKEIFEITHGKILHVTYWPTETKLDGQDSNSCLVEE